MLAKARGTSSKEKRTRASSAASSTGAKLVLFVIADGRPDSAITNIRQIRKETQAKIRGDENKWQNDAARWLSTGRRKVYSKTGRRRHGGG